MKFTCLKWSNSRKDMTFYPIICTTLHCFLFSQILIENYWETILKLLTYNTRHYPICMSWGQCNSLASINTVCWNDRNVKKHIYTGSTDNLHLYLIISIQLSIWSIQAACFWTMGENWSTWWKSSVTLQTCSLLLLFRNVREKVIVRLFNSAKPVFRTFSTCKSLI